MSIYMNESFAKAQGLLGGNPGGRGLFRVKRNTNLHQMLAQGRLPKELEELAGEEAPVSFKGAPITLRSGDVWVNNYPNCPGYGDPLDREPSLVAKDVADGKLSVREAKEVYGVVIGPNGKPDSESTDRHRAEIKRLRLVPQDVQKQAIETDGRREAPIGDRILVVRHGDSAVYRCACGHILGPAAGNFKDYCQVREVPASAIGPGYASSDPGAGVQMCFREFFCPGCGTRLTTELARVGDAYLWDIRLDL
jgi:N-methylhydantoinase B